MKQVVIISGKGGTGKTTITACLADLAAREKRLVLADADVDAANLELLLQPKLISKIFFNAGQSAEIDLKLCTACGRCFEVCRFEAVQTTSHYSIEPQLCEGCLTCLYQCPANAVRVKERLSGEWYQSSTDYGPLFHARLLPGEENSGKLVTEIIEHARETGTASRAELLLVDGPPGIGCPVTAACRGADLVVLVSEPTVSGKHDLQRVVQLTRHFNLPTLLILNKANLNENLRGEMLAFAQSEKIDLLGEIPYDERVLQDLFSGQPLTRLKDHPLSGALERIWQRLKEHIG